MGPRALALCLYSLDWAVAVAAAAAVAAVAGVGFGLRLGFVVLHAGILADLCCFECSVGLAEETRKELVADMRRVPW